MGAGEWVGWERVTRKMDCVIAGVGQSIRLSACDRSLHDNIILENSTDHFEQETNNNKRTHASRTQTSPPPRHNLQYIPTTFVPLACTKGCS